MNIRSSLFCQIISDEEKTNRFSNGVIIIKHFCLSVWGNKLECLSLACVYMVVWVIFGNISAKHHSYGHQNRPFSGRTPLTNKKFYEIQHLKVDIFFICSIWILDKQVFFKSLYPSLLNGGQVKPLTLEKLPCRWHSYKTFFFNASKIS